MALGNPMAAMAAQKALQTAKKVLTNRYVLGAIAIVLVIVLFRKGIKRAIERFREKKFDKGEHKDVNLIAQQYRDAVNPSGISWMKGLDGTDEDAILRLAYQSQGILKEISDAYRLKFSQALTDSLRQELSSDMFQRWFDIVK